MDTIADMLTRIRNGCSARHASVKVPYSKLAWNLAGILKAENFIGDFEKKGRKETKIIEIALKYEKKRPLLQHVRKISKPGRRVYRKSVDIFLKRGFVTIFSTPKGLLVDRDAKKQKVGGEVLCIIG